MAEEAEGADDDIEDGTEGGEGEGVPKKGGMKKLILFVGLPAIILILGGVAGALIFLGGGDEQDGEVVAGAEAGEVELTAAEQAAAYYEMEETPAMEVVVDIDTGGRSSALLKLQIVLVHADPDVGPLLEREDVQQHLSDTYVEFLRTLRVEDVNGSMGTFRLRSELLRRTNLVIAPAQVERVLLPETLIQQ
jgi:flagellar FliL protein